MKKVIVLFMFTLTTCVMVSCSDVKRKPGTSYMPDMAYSRAYETYAPHQNLKDSGINYTNMPVSGTIKRGELFPFALPMDAAGDSANYVASKQVVNPITTMDSAQTTEAERQYLINCGICHGAALDGNGPLYKDGTGPFPAKPANLITDTKYTTMPDGQMFYSVTYGKNLMGSYASQLSTTERWRIIHYIKSKQAAKNAPAAAAPKVAATDSVTAKK